MDERWPLKGPEPPDFGGHMPNHSEFPPENVEVMRRVGKFAYGCSNMKAALMWVNQARTESGLKSVSIGTLKYYLNKIAKANNFQRGHGGQAGGKRQKRQTQTLPAPTPVPVTSTEITELDCDFDSHVPPRTHRIDNRKNRQQDRQRTETKKKMWNNLRSTMATELTKREYPPDLHPDIKCGAHLHQNTQCQQSIKFR